jgi:copper chaperone CopZ
MNRTHQIRLCFTACFAFFASSVYAETKVEVKKTHVCCRQCVTAVAKVLDKAGVKGSANQESGTISFTAADDKAAQKVLDDLAAAGFHGDTGNKEVNIKDDSGAKDGKVTTLTLKGAHNCCGQCNTAIKKAIKSVSGVESEDAKPKGETITVKGNFDAKALIKSLNEAGFHVTAAN